MLCPTTVNLPPHDTYPKEKRNFPMMSWAMMVSGGKLGEMQTHSELLFLVKSLCNIF